MSYHFTSMESENSNYGSQSPAGSGVPPSSLSHLLPLSHVLPLLETDSLALPFPDYSKPTSPPEPFHFLFCLPETLLLHIAV